MSESTTPSDKEVPGSLPPGEPGNRAKLKCGECGAVKPLWYSGGELLATFRCRSCYEATNGPVEW